MQLFVYGTLKEPGRLNDLLGASVRWRVIGPARVRGSLYDCGEYPALVTHGAEDVVTGLLLEFADDRALPQLDAYEGVDSGLYVRERMQVELENGKRRTAWGYVYNRPIAALRRIGEWPSESD